MTEKRLPRLGILVSGRGSNFEAIAQNVDAGKLACEIAVVFSNKANAPALEHARLRNIPTASFPSASFDRAAYDTKVADLLEEHKVDWICLAGYMRLLSGSFTSRFRGRILNIHPSLLPAFPGLDAQAQAWSHGVKVAGCTVHFVDENLDSGPILLQRAVPVLDDDTIDSLSARILTEEHRLYSEALALVLSGSYHIEGRRVLKK